MSNILVLGGTGFVGRTLCEALVERAHGGEGRITVATRRPARAKAMQMLPALDLAAADVHDEKQLTRLVAGRDAVVNLVAVLHGSEASFRQVHVELPRKLARACRAAGVPRLVHVSSLGVAPQAPSRYLRSKWEGEDVLRQAGLALTVLRPSVIFGAADRFMNRFAALQACLPVLPLACAKARFQPVWVNDVAQAVVRVLDRPRSIGQTYECTGPRIFTLSELARLAGLWSKHPRPVVPLPARLGRLQAMLMECVPGEPLMSRDNLDSMRTPSIASHTLPGLEVLDIRAAALDAVMPPWLSHRGRGARMASPLR